MINLALRFNSFRNDHDPNTSADCASRASILISEFGTCILRGDLPQTTTPHIVHVEPGPDATPFWRKVFPYRECSLRTRVLFLKRRPPRRKTEEYNHSDALETEQPTRTAKRLDAPYQARTGIGEAYKKRPKIDSRGTPRQPMSPCPTKFGARATPNVAKWETVPRSRRR